MDVDNDEDQDGEEWVRIWDSVNFESDAAIKN